MQSLTDNVYILFCSLDVVCFDQPTISGWKQRTDDTEALPGQPAVLFELLLPSPDRYDIQGKQLWELKQVFTY